jgi:hypothetical protein
MIFLLLDPDLFANLDETEPLLVPTDHVLTDLALPPEWCDTSQFDLLDSHTEDDLSTSSPNPSYLNASWASTSLHKSLSPDFPIHPPDTPNDPEHAEHDLHKVRQHSLPSLHPPHSQNQVPISRALLDEVLRNCSIPMADPIDRFMADRASPFAPFVLGRRS